MRLGPALQLILTLGFAPLTALADDAGAVLVGVFEWEAPQGWFGGLSGLELSEDGTALTAITDRGRILFARISRDEERISGVEILRSNHLRLQNGRSLIGLTADSEGLAIAPDGTIFVSFEHVHRVARYPEATATAEGLPRPPALRALRGNAGLEALAMDAMGRLYTLPEKAFDDQGRIPVYRWDGAAWSMPFALPGMGGFLPVGADFGPDGRLYLLERDFNLFGFRSRVRSWQIIEDGAGDEKLHLETERRTHDNLEGISVWRDAIGRIRLTMVSDDNFMVFQRSELVEYALPEGLAQSRASR